MRYLQQSGSIEARLLEIQRFCTFAKLDKRKLGERPDDLITN